MTIKVYANYDGKVISEKDFLAKVEELTQDYDKDEMTLDEYLNNDFSFIDLFKMTDEDKETVRKNFHEQNYNYAKEELENEWKENTLEI